MKKSKKLLFQGIHVFIILNLLFEIGYCAYIVFFVLKPENLGSGPLMEHAMTIDQDLMMRRRLYAIEFWIAFVGLSIYLSLTSFKGFFELNKKNKF